MNCVVEDSQSPIHTLREIHSIRIKWLSVSKATVRSKTRMKFLFLTLAFSSFSTRQVESRPQQLRGKIPVAHQRRHQKDFERRASDSFPVQQLPADLQWHNQEQRPLG